MGHLRLVGLRYQLVATTTYLRLRLRYQLVAEATYLGFAFGCDRRRFVLRQKPDESMEPGAGSQAGERRTMREVEKVGNQVYWFHQTHL